MKPLATSLRAASLAVVAVALWWVGGGGTSTSSYYPLRRGLHWLYEVSTPAGGQVLQLTVTNLGKQKVGEWGDAVVQRLDVAGSVGYRYTVERPDFIATVAERGPGRDEPTVLEPPATLLRLPIELGQSWTSEATTTRIAPGTKFPVVAKIASVSDQIHGPAGRFDGCVRVESTGSTQVRIPDSDASGTVGVETRLWYARGVGVVQIERREFVASPEANETSVTYRLLGYGS